MKASQVRLIMVCISTMLLLAGVLGSMAEEKSLSLAEQIRSKIQQNKNISISNLVVTDEGKGEIKLQGSTAYYGSVYLAVREAAKFPITLVNTEIEVIPQVAKSDADIEKEIRAEIKIIQEGFSLKDIDLTVKDGDVRITGTATRKDLVDKIMNKAIWISGVVYARNEVKILK